MPEILKIHQFNSLLTLCSNTLFYKSNCWIPRIGNYTCKYKLAKKLIIYYTFNLYCLNHSHLIENKECIHARYVQTLEEQRPPCKVYRGHIGNSIQHIIILGGTHQASLSPHNFYSKNMGTYVKKTSRDHNGSCTSAYILQCTELSTEIWIPKLCSVLLIVVYAQFTNYAINRFAKEGTPPPPVLCWTSKRLRWKNNGSYFSQFQIDQITLSFNVFEIKQSQFNTH